MSAARILVIDDVAQNVKLLEQLLSLSGYSVLTAASGAEGLEKVASGNPDLVLLDVVMPKMSGYEVCRAIRANPVTQLLPVVMVTALDPAEERVKGIEAGADDFLSKPINQPELLARVKSLLRIRALNEEVARQKAELAEVRLARLRRFVSPKVADLIVAGELDDPLATRRREVTVMFVDLRGFTAFSEAAAPEDVLGVLREYHAEIGRLVEKHEGTIEHFAGDGVMLIFNDPQPLADPTLAAVRMATELRAGVEQLAAGWSRMGYKLGCGIGIAQGFATIGTIGFPGRHDYGVIGAINNLAARLCTHAEPGQVLISQRVFGRLEGRISAKSIGTLPLKGLSAPVPAWNVVEVESVAEAMNGR